MKRIKRLAALVLALGLCVSLCGCKQLNEKRAVHGLRQNDGSIVMDGKTYRPVNYEYMLDFHPYTKTTECYITDNDVPVLLSKRLGSYANLAGDVLMTFDETGDYYAEESRLAYYDRAHPLERMGVVVYKPAEDSSIWREEMIVLDEATKAALESEVTPAERSGELLMRERICVCSEDGLFSRDALNILQDEFGHYYRENVTDGSLGRYGDEAQSVVKALLEQLEQMPYSNLTGFVVEG